MKKETYILAIFLAIIVLMTFYAAWRKNQKPPVVEPTFTIEEKTQKPIVISENNFTPEDGQEK